MAIPQNYPGSEQQGGVFVHTENARNQMSSPTQIKMKENRIPTWKNSELIWNSAREATHINLSEELEGKDYLRLKLIYSWSDIGLFQKKKSGFIMHLYCPRC